MYKQQWLKNNKDYTNKRIWYNFLFYSINLFRIMSLFKDNKTKYVHNKTRLYVLDKFN